MKILNGTQSQEKGDKIIYSVEMKGAQHGEEAKGAEIRSDQTGDGKD